MPLSVPASDSEDIEFVVQNVGAESVAVYRFLSARFASTDPDTDRVFQFVFRSFYRLDSGGLTPEFKALFFALLGQGKRKGRVVLVDIVRQLWAVPTLKGLAALQFSFATKLVATVDPHCPIYDTAVASVFGFRPPNSCRTFEERISAYMEFYREVQNLYARLLVTGELDQGRRLFREMYEAQTTEVADEKVLDFIFWSAGKLRKRAAASNKLAGQVVPR